jgi:hypothetical protein
MGSGPIFRSTLEWITVVCAVVGTAVATWQGYLLSRTYLQPFQANRQLQQMDVCAEFVFRAAEFLVSVKLAQTGWPERKARQPTACFHSIHVVKSPRTSSNSTSPWRG